MFSLLPRGFGLPIFTLVLFASQIPLPVVADDVIEYSFVIPNGLTTLGVPKVTLDANQILKRVELITILEGEYQVSLENYSETATCTMAVSRAGAAVLTLRDLDQPFVETSLLSFSSVDLLFEVAPGETRFGELHQIDERNLSVVDDVSSLEAFIGRGSLVLSGEYPYVTTEPTGHLCGNQNFGSGPAPELTAKIRYFIGENGAAKPGNTAD